MLPHPESFARYPDHVQERMMRWNDAFTVDESARQDRLVDAQIEQARKGPNRALVVVLTAMVGAGASAFVFDNTVVAACFLGTPVLLFASNLVQTVTSWSNKGEPEDSSDN